MAELIENEFFGEPVPCPFCGEPIRVWIGGECGREIEGSTKINHFCPSGLCIEWGERRQDGAKAIEALKTLGERTNETQIRSKS